MAYELLLREGRVNSMRMRNRLIAGPMERAMANRDGSLNHRYIDYLAERARGGVALSVIESTYIDPIGMGNRHQVGIHSDHVIPGLRRAADAVHAADGKLGTELYFAGRVTPSIVSERQPVGVSSVPNPNLSPQPIPRELTEPELAGIRDKFADAAERAVDAGLDMVHIHGAHGYLLGAFLSPFTNKRTDAYGGTLANRARYPLSVLAAVRAVVGDDYPIGWRLSAEEYVPGGVTIDDVAAFCVMLADAGIDLIDVAGGIPESLDVLCQSALDPRGGFVSNALAIKEAVGDRVPVSVAQRLNEPDLANDVLAKGLDYITMARAFHADPHFARKLHEGKPEEIIPCIGCMRCSDLLGAGQQSRCTINTATSLERRRRSLPARQPQSVMVVGGGAAGLQAACLLAERGHTVSLYEELPELGGQIRYSARVARDYGRLVEHLAGRLERMGSEVRLGERVGLDLIRATEPDAVVIATGASPGLWFCPVDPEALTFNLFSAFDRSASEWDGGAAVIIGADTASSLLALHIAGAGGRVHLIDPQATLAHDSGFASALTLKRTIERTPAIEFHAETTAELVKERSVLVQRRGDYREIGSDAVIVGGRVANNLLYEDLLIADLGSTPCYEIGDAVLPRDMYVASHEAADIAERIHLGARALAEA